MYADTDTARNVLFPYCPPEILDVDYRKQLYLKEIMGKFILKFSYNLI